MASIEKRGDNKYRITVSCGYDAKGKKLRKYKTITLSDTLTERQKEKELQRITVLFEQEVQNGTYLDGDKITLGEFAEKWLAEYAEKQLAPSTLQSYKSRLNHHIIPALGHIKLSRIQPHHLLEFYNNLSENGIRLDSYYKPSGKIVSLMQSMPVVATSQSIGIDSKTFTKVKNGERIRGNSAKKVCDYFEVDINENFSIDGKDKLSSKSIKHLHDLISAILSTAVEWNIISNNPAHRVKKPKVARPQIQYYDDKQVAELFYLLEPEPLKYKTLIYLTIDTGFRVSELAGLLWSDINIDEKIIAINKQRQYVSGYGILVREPKTDNGFRQISVSDTVCKLLMRYKTEQTTNRIKLGSVWVVSDNVFVHEDGLPIYPNRPYQWFQSFIERHTRNRILNCTGQRVPDSLFIHRI